MLIWPSGSETQVSCSHSDHKAPASCDPSSCFTFFMFHIYDAACSRPSTDPARFGSLEFRLRPAAHSAPCRRPPPGCDVTGLFPGTAAGVGGCWSGREDQAAGADRTRSVCSFISSELKQKYIFYFYKHVTTSRSVQERRSR